MSSFIEVTLENPTEMDVPTDRVWVAKNMTKQNIEHFDKVFQKLAEQQNQEESYVSQMGKVQVDSLPLRAHKRIQTPEEKKRKKREYNMKRNKLEIVKQKRRENAMKEENRKKRELANKDPQKKREKTLSGMKRRRALWELKQQNEALYLECIAKGSIAAEQDLAKKEQMLLEQDDAYEKEITQLETELQQEQTMSEDE